MGSIAADMNRDMPEVPECMQDNLLKYLLFFPINARADAVIGGGCSAA